MLCSWVCLGSILLLKLEPHGKDIKMSLWLRYPQRWKGFSDFNVPHFRHGGGWRKGFFRDLPIWQVCKSITPTLEVCWALSQCLSSHFQKYTHHFMAYAVGYPEPIVSACGQLLAYMPLWTLVCKGGILFGWRGVGCRVPCGSCKAALSCHWIWPLLGKIKINQDWGQKAIPSTGDVWL